MEKALNKQEEYLEKLLASKAYEALSDKEKEEVHALISAEEYRLRRTLIEQSASLDDELVPLPLKTEKKQNKAVVIPLNQAVAGIAAAVVITFFLVNKQEINIDWDTAQTLAVTDTVIVEKERIDTIIQYETKYVDRIVEVPQKKSQDLVVSTSGVSAPELSALSIGNKGNAMSKDATTALVNDLVVQPTSSFERP